MKKRLAKKLIKQLVYEFEQSELTQETVLKIIRREYVKPIRRMDKRLLRKIVPIIRNRIGEVEK